MTASMRRGSTPLSSISPVTLNFRRRHPPNRKQGVSPIQLSTWILANCATVAEVKQKIDEVAVLGVYLKYMQTIPEMHYKIQDASGACITIEPIDGALKVYDNPLRVVTNSPGFPWHITHLSSFLNLTPAYPGAERSEKIRVHPLVLVVDWLACLAISHRLTFRADGHLYPKLPATPRLAHAVGSTFHLLNNFDIPRGSNMPSAKTAEAESDYTSWDERE